MIPRSHVTAWRKDAPWPTDAQVEQDLVISRALVEMFSKPVVAESVAFRGGTALHKLFVQPPGRYSEDIDLVQVEAGPIGAVLDALRSTLDPWLGEPRRKRGHGRVILLYRFESTSQPVQRISRAEFEANLVQKMRDPAFTADLGPLLAPGVDWELTEAARLVIDELIPRLPGEPWKGLSRLSDEAG